MEEPDTDPPEVKWSIKEYSSKENNGKLRWMLDKGLSVGKKILVTGVVISSAPIVLPPLAVISVIGFACSVPYALFLASYACTNKLMSKLLSEPEPPLYLLEYGTVLSSTDESSENDRNGKEGEDKGEEEMWEDTRISVEMRIELAIELKIGGLGKEEEKQPVVEEEKTFVVDIKRDETSGRAVEGSGTTFKVTNVVVDFRQDADIEEDEEIVRETTGLLEKIREEGMAENGEENNWSVEKGPGGAGEGDLRVDSQTEVMRMPFETRNYYANVEMERPLTEIECKIVENEDDETRAESGEMPETEYVPHVDLIPKEMEPKPVVGDLLATKEREEVLEAEKPTGEKSGSKSLGFAENVDVVPEEMKPKPVVGDLAATKESDKVLEAEKPTGEMKETDEVLKAKKPTGEMSGTTDLELAKNVDVVPEEMKPKAVLGDVAATKESDEVLEAETPTGEMSGSRNFGYAENVDVVTEEMKPKPEAGDLATTKESDGVLEAEKPMGEMSGSRNFGYAENVDVVTEEMKPKPEVGDLAATKESDEVLEAEKPTGEMSGSRNFGYAENVDVVTEEMKPKPEVGDLAATKESEEVLEAEKPTGELSGSRNLGIMENVDVVPEEMKPKPELRESAAMKETDEVLKAEKPTGEMSGTTDFEFAEDVVPEEMKPKAVVGDLAATKESDEVLEAQKSTSKISGTTDVGGNTMEDKKPVASQQEGSANGNITKDAQQDSQLSMKKEIVISTNADARESANESVFDLFDTNNVAVQLYSDADFNTVEENKQSSSIAVLESADLMDLPVNAGDRDRNDTGISSQKNIGYGSSKQEYVTEEKILEKIEAMRVIVGYKAARQATCLEELKALYLFTGVEPPASFKDPSELMEINDKLRFLMSIVGVK